MEELNQIFEKLDAKKEVISQYFEKFKALDQSTLSKKEINKQSKHLYHDFNQALKSIDKN